MGDLDDLDNFKDLLDQEQLQDLDDALDPFSPEDEAEAPADENPTLGTLRGTVREMSKKILKERSQRAEYMNSSEFLHTDRPVYAKSVWIGV